MLTLGQINATTSELRSKIAVFEALVLYVKTNYLGSDDGAAEMHFTRNDHGRVPAAHIEATILELIDQLDMMKQELEKWETTPLSDLLAPPKLDVEPKPPEPVVEPAVTAVNGSIKEPHGTRRQDRNQTASAQATVRRAG